MARRLVLNAIARCDTLETLNLFACSNLWKTDRTIFFAIEVRHDELAFQPNAPRRYVFGDEDYFNARFGEFQFPDDNGDGDGQLDNIQIGHGQDAPSQQEDPENFYDLSDAYQERIKQFRTNGQTFKLKFKNLDKTDIVSVGASVFNHVLDHVADDNNDSNVRLGVSIRHPSLDRPVLIPFRKRKEITGDAVMREIERVMQSVKALQFDDTIEITVTRVSPPVGTGRDTNKIKWLPWFSRHCGNGGCFIQVKNADDLCLARAIVTAKARHHKDDSPEAHRFYKVIAEGDRNRKTRQREEAKSLMQLAGLGDHQGGCGLDEIKKIQDVMPKYQLKVFWKENFNALLFKGPETNIQLCLYFHDNHFTVITSIAAFFGANYYCHQCNKTYSKKDQHRCDSKCFQCFRVGKEFPCRGKEHIHCADCNIFFSTQDCFDEHKKSFSITIGRGQERRKVASSICRRFWRCSKCGKLICVKNLKGESHQCGTVYCTICDRFLPSGHTCFMKRIGGTKKKPNADDTEASDDADEAQDRNDRAKFIFWDFETRQETHVGENAQGPIMRHIVNYCVVQRACDLCADLPIERDCETCGERQLLFSGDNCLDEFCSWLFNEDNKGSTVLAHNMSGFDGQFLLEYLHKQAIKPEVVLRGLSIMLLKTSTVTIKDTLNYLSMPLSAFPKTFGLTELKKGYYPFLFNTKENENYEGPFPPASDYGADQMKPAARDQFLRWYQKQIDTGAVFDNAKSLREYCISDVQILREGAMMFRRDFIEHTSVDPFVLASTIAGACSYVYRKNFMPENSIALIPEGGYRREQKQSVVALRWMMWLEESESLRIQHKLTGGEVQVPGTNFRVDGFIDRSATGQRPLALEFHGCSYHGCTKCFMDRQKQLPNGLTALEAYQRTLERRRIIERHFDVQEMWECDLYSQLQVNKEMRKFFDECEVVDVLDPRAALYGGRTGASKLYYKTGPSETMSYIDICSLYPFVNSRKSYPTGEPTIITRDFDTLTETHQPYRGLMKVTVLPPKQLYHPLLPRRVNKKLLFPLCRTCADNQLNETCTHSDAERQFTGEFSSMEVTKALELGYKIVKVHEVWNWDHWMTYDGADPKTGLFTEYIQCFLRLKAEASGYPPGVDTDEQKDKYIKTYFEREGVLLDKNKIVFNTGKRALAKICCNSFWGKFAQRQNLTKTVYFTDPSEYFSLICDDSNEVLSVKSVCETMVVVCYQKRSEHWVEPIENVNVVLGALTTAHARLVLYSYLEKLGDRVAYYDTDSVIYITRPSDTYHPPIGQFLGDMTSELPPNYSITEFVAGGAKQYAYHAQSPDGQSFVEVLKIRGFTLGYSTGLKLHFAELRRMVLAMIHQRDPNDAVTLTFTQICRNPDRSVVTKTVTKTYRPVFNKRRLLMNYDTLPYGYVD